MVEPAVINSIKRYLAALPKRGIHPCRAVLYGSFARGEATEWSDIDLVVIAPEFDQDYSQSDIESLWVARIDADIRIEPIPCGEREWTRDSDRPIIEIARNEGIIIAA